MSAAGVRLCCVIDLVLIVLIVRRAICMVVLYYVYTHFAATLFVDGRHCNTDMFLHTKTALGRLATVLQTA